MVGILRSFFQSFGFEVEGLGGPVEKTEVPEDDDDVLLFELEGGPREAFDCNDMIIVVVVVVVQSDREPD